LVSQAWFEYKTIPSFSKSIFDRALEHLSPVKPRHATDISQATLSTGPPSQQALPKIPPPLIRIICRHGMAWCGKKDHTGAGYCMAHREHQNINPSYEKSADG
jgi:hypothetical protein